MIAAHLDIVHNDQGPTHTANGAVVCTGSIWISNCCAVSCSMASHKLNLHADMQSSETQ